MGARTIRHIKSSEGGVNRDATVYFLLANIKVDIKVSDIPTR